MSIHIVLVCPQIPNNTGSIIRLCANSGATLHLVKPLGFDLDDKKMRRAGLDYHEYANMQVHESWQAAKAALQQQQCHQMVALTTKLSQPFYEYDFSHKGLLKKDNVRQKNGREQTVRQQTKTPIKKISNEDELANKLADDNRHAANVALVFGSETKGLPNDIRADIGKDNWLRLPMLPNSRSLNLANSVAICLYEVWRQQGFFGDEGKSEGYDNLTPYQPPSHD